MSENGVKGLEDDEDEYDEDYEIEKEEGSDEGEEEEESDDDEEMEDEEVEEEDDSDEEMEDDTNRTAWILPPEYPGRYISSLDEDIETEKQNRWTLTTLVPPDEREIEITEKVGSMNDDNEGILKTDAQLYRIKERNLIGSVTQKSMIKMPSSIPRILVSKNEEKRIADHNTLNIFMGDVSISMDWYWPEVVEGWNNHVAPKLVGKTMMYTFGTRVNYKRTATNITQEDFDGDYTNLTGAFMTILEEIYMCKEKYINVFLVTDGGHNVTDCEPGKIIERMNAAEGKIVNVFVLGCGNDFPVTYSVGIRSKLHSGSSNIPTLFWAKEVDGDEGVVQKFKDISSYLEGGRSSVQVEVNFPGRILPKMKPQKMFHLGEYIFFDQEPETLTEVSFKFGRNIHGKVKLISQDITLDILLNIVFRQWNGVLIQLRDKEEDIPEGIIDHMETIYDSTLHYVKEDKGDEGKSIENKISEKDISGYDETFKTFINSVKSHLISKEYLSEIDLANHVVSTTVVISKCDERNIKDAEIADDEKEIEECNVNSHKTLATDKVSADEGCRATLTSTTSDTQDGVDYFKDDQESNKKCYETSDLHDEDIPLKITIIITVIAMFIEVITRTLITVYNGYN